MAGSIFDVMFSSGEAEEKPKGQQGLLRPSFVKRSGINVSQWFEIEPLWEHVKAHVKDAPRGRRIELPLVQITHPGLDEARAAYETAYFFDKVKEISNLDTKAAWDRVLLPFLDEVEETLNAKKPKELPGRLRFDVAPDSSLTLFYMTDKQ
jgi:hypothetical protein